MKDSQKESEKQKMPRMLSLLIWHKGAWHQLVLSEGFDGQDESLENTFEELDNASTKGTFN